MRRNGFDIDFAFGCLCRLGSHAFLISGGVLFHGIKKSLAVGAPATKRMLYGFTYTEGKWRFLPTLYLVLNRNSIINKGLVFLIKA